MFLREVLNEICKGDLPVEEVVGRRGSIGSKITKTPLG